MTDNKIEIVFFSGNSCGVCHVIKPKLKAEIRQHFPEVHFTEIVVDSHPEIAAQHMVFTLPVVIIKLNDAETYRFARSFGIGEVLEKLKRLESVMK